MSVVAHAEDWPRWRGAEGTGISRENVIDRFPAGGPVVLWKAQVGIGFSSFAVGGGRCYTMGHIGESDVVTCLDAATGKELWKQSHPADLDDKLFEGGPTAAPTLEGENLYTLGRQGALQCLAAENGAVKWAVNVREAAKVRVPGWGLSCSPIVKGDRVVLNAGDAGIALDKRDGRILWKSADKDGGYSSAVFAGESAIFASGRSIVGVDLATGRELWRYPWITRYGINAADPIVAGDRLFISSGYGKGGALLKITGAKEPELLWKTKELATHLNGALLIGNRLYGFDGDASGGDEEGGGEAPESAPGAPGTAALRCIDLETGKAIWSDKQLGFGSIIAAGKRFIALSEKGELAIAPISDRKFEPTARARILTGRCWTAPVLSNGKLFCRNAAGDVVALDLSK